MKIRSLITKLITKITVEILARPLAESHTRLHRVPFFHFYHILTSCGIYF